jgi:hypothetical protein
VLEILVVERQVADALPQLDLDALRGGVDRSPEQARVVRVGAQAAGDGQDPHD